MNFYILRNLALFFSLIGLLLFTACGSGGGSGSGGTTAGDSSAYSIGGTITGLTAAGLVLQNNSADDLPVASGTAAFVFATKLKTGAPYSVTVKTQPTGLTCTLAALTNSGTVATADVSNVAVSCQSSNVPTYSIGGTITGLTAAGLALKDANAGKVTVATSDATFVLPTKIPAGTAYSVRVDTQPTGQSCVLSNADGTAGANVMNVAVTCTSAYSIGGTITGLTAAGLVLQNNSADDLPVVSGTAAFVFATKLRTGAPYSVTVKTQPTGLTCIVAGGSGAVASVDVTNVSVACNPISAPVVSDATTVSLQFGEMGLDVSLASPDSKGTGFVIANASKRTLDVASLSGASLAALNAASRPAGANDFVSVKTNGLSGFADATLQFTTSGGSATGLQLQVHYYRPVSASNNATTDATYTFVFPKYDAATNPYGVYGPGDLSYVRNALDATYQQRKNIVFNVGDATAKLGIADYDTGGWLPIGDNGHSFTGSYNGGGFTIDKLHLSRPSADNQGLFGYTSGSASITKLGLTNLDVTGNSNVGGLVGYQGGRAISQAYAAGRISSPNGTKVGGLVGWQSSGSIAQAYATGAVSSASGSYVGGLVGTQSGSIRQSYATATVRGSILAVGGLVGQQATGGFISQAYATGTVTGGDRAGGLVGDQGDADILQAYATGTVVGGTGVGGLVGSAAGRVTATYASGFANGSSRLGGLVGILGSSASFSSSYYLKANPLYFGADDRTVSDIAGMAGVTTGTTDSSFAGFIWTDQASTAGVGAPANNIWTRTGAVSGGAKGNWPVFGGAWLSTGWGDTTPTTQTLQSLP